LKESVVLDPRVLEEDTSLKTSTLSDDTSRSDNNVRSDRSRRVDGCSGVNQDVASNDGGVGRRVGKFSRFSRGEVRKVEASSGEVIYNAREM
jgi:hypothetical protein